MPLNPGRGFHAQATSNNIAAIETSVLKTASMYSERLSSMNARLPSMTTDISKRINRL